MTRWIISFFLFLTILVSPTFVSAQQAIPTGTAECDACGYCMGLTPPSTWNNCRQCLYPATGDSPADQNLTLLVDQTPGETLNQQVTPHPGRYYTQLGCLKTDLNDFTSPGAAGGITNQLLNSLIFPITGALAFFYLIYGAFLIMTAQGDPGRLQQGKTVATGAVAGLLFVMFSVFTVSFISTGVLRIPGFSTGTDGPAQIQGIFLPYADAKATNMKVSINGKNINLIDETARGRIVYYANSAAQLQCGKSYTISVTVDPAYRVLYSECPNCINHPPESFKEGSSRVVFIPGVPAPNYDTCYMDLHWKIERK